MYPGCMEVLGDEQASECVLKVTAERTYRCGTEPKVVVVSPSVL